MTNPQTTTACGKCGMPCHDREYHPFAACLMFESCKNAGVVRVNLKAVLDRGEEIANAKREI